LTTTQEKHHEGAVAKLAHWFDNRLGLSYPMLRPAPVYAINPFYWLGALTVVAFVIQGITGIIMMLYYVPTPVAAYSSTEYIFQSVSYGRFLQTVHLYTAYAMIVLAFMHMMRGYFVSVYKKPRELMWIIGMVMGFVTLGFGFTGYLLPWTVVSKSATDVGVGMIDALPPSIANLLTFLIVGAGGDATELLRFYDLHVIILPAILLVLLAVKMYMLESHGISEAIMGKELPEKKKALVPIFPDVSLYLLELAAIFGSGMLLISALFPLNLPPQFTPALAAQTAAQPDWYFLWIYQILKIKIFEGAGLPVALSLVTLLFIVLILLPFIDRNQVKRPSMRPRFVTLGIIFIVELAALAYWGLVSPGQVIPTEQAVLVLGGIALIVALVSLGLFRLLTVRTKERLPTAKVSNLRSVEIWNGLAFTFFAGLCALTIGTSIDGFVKLWLGEIAIWNIIYLIISLAGLALSILGTTYMIYRSDLSTGMIKRRIRAFEIGWDE
jgi:quinol-cytochrome oxidoreductase complex cytochrome b subunit